MKLFEHQMTRHLYECSYLYGEVVCIFCLPRHPHLHPPPKRKEKKKKRMTKTIWSGVSYVGLQGGVKGLSKTRIREAAKFYFIPDK